MHMSIDIVKLSQQACWGSTHTRPIAIRWQAIYVSHIVQNSYIHTYIHICGMRCIYMYIYTHVHASEAIAASEACSGSAKKKFPYLSLGTLAVWIAVRGKVRFRWREI
jgi:hypothetical protein